MASTVASFPVLPRTQFTFTCGNCGGEHFETGKAWSETSREVDVCIIYMYKSSILCVYKHAGTNV